MPTRFKLPWLVYRETCNKEGTSVDSINDFIVKQVTQHCNAKNSYHPPSSAQAKHAAVRTQINELNKG